MNRGRGNPYPLFGYSESPDSGKEKDENMEATLSFEHISKYFPGVQALSNVSFSASGGRVLALMGENGAGKSTLLKILSGDQKPDEGQICLNGVPLKFESPHYAICQGISVIYQERQILPELSVMENIFVGDLPSIRAGVLNRRQLHRETKAILDRFGLDIDPETPAKYLSVAQQQMLEIMKAYRRNTTVIAFDEPTASLMDSEINTLFGLIEELKQQGKIILYISHRMSEIFRITDEIAVLKDGRFVRQIPTHEITEQELIRSMVGRDIGDTYSGLKRVGQRGNAILELRNVTTQKLKDVSLTLHRGEILGIAGLAGSGRTEIANAVFGVDAVANGEILLDGKRIHFRNPKQAISAGIALCPEDRKEQGLVLIRSITDNVCMPVLRKLQSGVFLNRKKQRSLADEAVEKYAIKTPTTDKAVIELSGGNQQKVILGRWTSNAANTRILILDEPTKGIDVETKAEIYQMICDFASKGMAIIFISSELTEVIHLADRIIVMRDGMVSGEVTRENASEESILTLAMKE